MSGSADGGLIVWEVTFLDGKLDWRLQAHLQVDCFVLQTDTTHPGSVQNILNQICDSSREMLASLLRTFLRIWLKLGLNTFLLSPAQKASTLRWGSKPLEGQAVNFERIDLRLKPLPVGEPLPVSPR